jgi:hypothetical protein
MAQLRWKHTEGPGTVIYVTKLGSTNLIACGLVCWKNPARIDCSLSCWYPQPGAGAICVSRGREPAVTIPLRTIEPPSGATVDASLPSCDARILSIGTSSLFL